MRVMDVSNIPQIKIERPLYENEELRQNLEYQKPKKSCGKCGDLQIKKIASSMIPSVSWLGHYRWKTDLLPDIISGCTVAIMQIPQGMAFALLANIPPVVGIYTAFFPVLVYAFLGTSRHNSMGTLSIICLMLGKAVLEHSNPKYFDPNHSANETITTGYSPTQVTTIVTFTTGIFQLTTYILRLGSASVLLSDTLVSGFTTGAAIQVIVSQFKHILGLKIERYVGNFIVIKTMRGIISAIGNTNFTALIVSAVAMTVTAFNNEVLKPIVAKRSIFPIPIELIVVVIGTLVAKFCYLNENYGITIVGDIPAGLPEPHAPPFELMSSVVLDGLTIAIVSYTLSFSVGLIYAQKLDYEINANQELLAIGTSNIFGSFFPCVPLSSNLPTTAIQHSVGGKTQLVSLVSCSVLVFVLMWIGPLFESLPKCILASVILVSFKSFILQMKDVVKFWKYSKMDALVWLATFLTVVLVGIDIGLLVGICMSLTVIFALGFKPYTCLLGLVPNTDIYLDIGRYKGTKEINGLKIFHYSGGINFATRNIFKTELYDQVKLNPQKEVVYRKKIAEHIASLDEKKQKSLKKIQGKVNTNLKCLIIDCSSVSYIDPSGVSTLQNVIDSFQKLQISVYFAGCSDKVYAMMEKCNLVSSKKPSVRFFYRVHDAVQNAQILFGLT